MTDGQSKMQVIIDQAEHGLANSRGVDPHLASAIDSLIEAVKLLSQAQLQAQLQTMSDLDRAQRSRTDIPIG